MIELRLVLFAVLAVLLLISLISLFWKKWRLGKALFSVAIVAFLASLLFVNTVLPMKNELVTDDLFVDLSITAETLNSFDKISDDEISDEKAVNGYVKRADTSADGAVSYFCMYVFEYENAKEGLAYQSEKLKDTFGKRHLSYGEKSGVEYTASDATLSRIPKYIGVGADYEGAIVFRLDTYVAVVYYSASSENESVLYTKKPNKTDVSESVCKSIRECLTVNS